MSSPWIDEFSCDRVCFVLLGWDTLCEFSQPWSSTIVTTGRERLLGNFAALIRVCLSDLAQHNKSTFQDCASIASARISFIRVPPRTVHVVSFPVRRGVVGHTRQFVFDGSTGRIEDSLAMDRLVQFSRTKLTSDELLRRLLRVEASDLRWCVLLSPNDHALCAAALSSWISEDPDLPDDLQFAIRRHRWDQCARTHFIRGFIHR